MASQSSSVRSFGTPNISYESTGLASGSQQSFQRLDTLYKIYTSSRDKLDPSQVWSFLEFCAIVIQKWWRKIHNDNRKASLSSLSQSRSGHTDDWPLAESQLESIVLPATPPCEEDAACMIQKAWHQYVNKQVYKYYRNLLNFKATGDPAEFLRSINPREAHLVDPAAGTHVRFRLGGESFPPSIYYKIYSSGNVVDIGNFAPRYYTEPGCKKIPPRYLHNKGLGDQRDKLSSWYEREENNEWRLVSGHTTVVYVSGVVTNALIQMMQLYLGKDVDISRSLIMELLRLNCPVRLAEPVKKKKFVLLSRADQMRKMRKKKRIQWLKLFHQKETLGLPNGKNGVDDVIISAAKGMSDVAARKGEDAVEDWEIEELLEWTNGLDFDDYLRNWMESGTSTNSRALREVLATDASGRT